MKKLRSHDEANSQARTQAAHYVTRLYSGELTAREEADIQAWRQADPAHELEFQAMLNLWDISNNLYQPACTKPPMRRRIRSWSVSAAAGMLLTFGLMYLLTDSETPSAEAPLVLAESTPERQAEEPAGLMPDQLAPILGEYEYHHTLAGEVDTIGLSDGTAITLNANTTVRIHFHQEERHVSLLNGEAFFAVAREEERPFVLDTGEQTIRVLGTKFNVHRDAEQVRVAVIEGKVAVSRETENRPQLSTEALTASTSGYLLEAGAIGSFSATAEVVSPASYEQVEAAQSWRQGVFRFDNEPLSVVVAEYNRYRSRKLYLADNDAGDLRISGVFHFNNSDALLSALEATLPVQVSETERGLAIALSE